MENLTLIKNWYQANLCKTFSISNDLDGSIIYKRNQNLIDDSGEILIETFKTLSAGNYLIYGYSENGKPATKLKIEVSENDKKKVQSSVSSLVQGSTQSEQLGYIKAQLEFQKTIFDKEIEIQNLKRQKFELENQISIFKRNDAENQKNFQNLQTLCKEQENRLLLLHQEKTGFASNLKNNAISVAMAHGSTLLKNVDLINDERYSVGLKWGLEQLTNIIKNQQKQQ